jgi:predicted dehydrogenase
MINKKGKMINKNAGVALVGMGEYAVTQLIPALQETSNCHLAALVSGNEEKLVAEGKQHGISPEHLYTYDRFDTIADDAAVDIVYITLPNFLHSEYVIRAAAAGKHIICEKPMAMNPAECQHMIQAARDAGILFSMGYRLHFDPFHRELMRLGQQEVFGPVKRISLRNSMNAKKEGWRLDAERSGGGPLMNNGIYCIQAAIYIMGKLPVAVSAHFSNEQDTAQVNGVEQGIRWTLFFDNNVVADCESHYDADEDMIFVEADSGWFKLEPAFAYGGLKGETSEGPICVTPINQQAAQLDDFASCILTGRDSLVPAEMGMRDMEIIAAIYDAAKRRNCLRLTLQDMPP